MSLQSRWHLQAVIKNILLGKFTEQGTGFIPKSKIVRTHNSQTKHAIKSIEVKHTHGLVRIDFKSYSQNVEALMGAGIDLIAIDEEPKNPRRFMASL